MTRFNSKLIHRNNILYCHERYTHILSLFEYIYLTPSSSLMMSADAFADHSSKNVSYNVDTLHCLVQFLLVGQHHPSCCHHFRSQSSLLVVNLLHCRPALLCCKAGDCGYIQLLYLTGLFTTLNWIQLPLSNNSLAANFKF